MPPSQPIVNHDWLKQNEMLYLQYMNVLTFILFHNYTKHLLQAVKEMFEKTLNANNRMYFLSDEDFNYMAAAKHLAEEGIGWKTLPENIVFRI